MAEATLCGHLAAITSITISDAYVCDECVQTGDSWVHLRTCQECGRTHCCDNSSNQHATKHFQATQHPVIASAEPGERWLWCYRHTAFAEY